MPIEGLFGSASRYSLHSCRSCLPAASGSVSTGGRAMNQIDAAPELDSHLRHGELEVREVSLR